ncbi:MAG TPA: hypothetical protein VJ600_10900 [Holophagaceae bacterium]|nr:hypothetical protein [Holophagaceae bacterium]
MREEGPGPEAPGFEAKLAFLRSAAPYEPGGPPPECIETHMSWLFLAGPRAYKLKKPVRYPILDFTTQEARAFFCREEVRLNGKLAPGVYLGVMALQWCEGRFQLLPETRLPAPGRTVDWLVAMRRLPAGRMLPGLLAAGNVTPGEVEALAEVLAAFYATAAPVHLSPGEFVGRFRCELATSREVLLRPQFRLSRAADALSRFEEALLVHARLLEERASRLVDGHGDLRPEHICLVEPPVVIDCVEFNPRLREVDPFQELAFLAMECELAGQPWIGPRLLARCSELLGDEPAPDLLDLYTVHSALLRARLAMAHLLDPTPTLPDAWTPVAERHLARALAALEGLLHASRA